MDNKVVRIGVDALDIGMYVTKLDRPWMETPFLLEGLLISSHEEVSQLQALCSHVYVDTERGTTPSPQFWSMSDDIDPKETNSAHGEAVFGPNEYTELRSVTYESTSELNSELPVAEKKYEQITTDYKLILEDLKKGKRIDIERVQQSVEVMVDSILRNPSAFVLVKQLRERAEYSYSHALGTSVWCATFGRHLGLERNDIEGLALGGMLLDVGKVKMPAELINKREALSEDEMELMRSHVDKSVRTLAGNQSIPNEVFRMVATHHERADGSGYPMGLKNEEIPIFGRIAGIVDSYDAMTTKRPYRSDVLSPHEAINELHGMKGKIFQAELVEQFIQAVGLYPTGSLVELSTGEVAVVIEVNSMRRLRPSIMVLLDSDKKPYEEFKLIDLNEIQEDINVNRSLPPNAYGIKMQELFL